MSDYERELERIRRAGSLDEIRDVVRRFSATASGEGGILYSRNVGDVPSEVIARELSARTGAPIINDTPRAQFLMAAQDTIEASAERIFRAEGQSLVQAQASRSAFLFGDAQARGATSLDNCLWGEASRDFARSLRGDIRVVASNANIERVFGKVELPEVLANPNVRTLGGQPIESLRAAYAAGGADAVLPRVQAQFIEAVPRGLFVSSGNAGTAPTRVTLSREFASAMEVNPAQLGSFASTAELTAGGLARAPTGSLSAAAGEAAIGAEAAALRGLSPGAARFVRGAGAAGVALMAYDFATTGHQVLQLRAQGNTTGADSATTHFIGRNAGGVLGGFLVGAGYGALSGSYTGPGAIVTAIGGGIAGAWLGDRWAQQQDNDRVYLQRDGSGSEWRRDPADPQGQWTRTADTQRVSVTPAEPAGRGAIDVNVSPAAPTGMFGTGTTQSQRYVAGGALENRLNYQAANASYELGLANLPEPQNPYRLPSAAGDQRSLGGSGDAWVRNPENGSWSREVVLGYYEHGIKHSITDIATPQRAAQLDQQSALVVAQNAANTPAAIAARYRIAYDQFQWSQFGPVPEAVSNAAARPGTLLASDGSTYTRGADGGWTTPGMIYGTNAASGNVRAELDTTYASQNAGLAQMNEIAEYARRNPPPARDELREMLSGAYRAAGVTRTDAQLDAATAAVRAGHARDGLTTGYSLRLLADPATGRPGANSAIASFADDGSGNMVLKSVTQADALQPAPAIPAAPQPPRPQDTRDPTTPVPGQITRISDGVSQALPGITERDAGTLAFALDRQRIDDGLREINTVARNNSGTLLFGVQDAALRTAPVDIAATLAQSPESVRAQWQATVALPQPQQQAETQEQARVRTA